MIRVSDDTGSPGTAMFKCDFCGTVVEKVKHNGLRDKSCGCVRYELIAEAQYRSKRPDYKHGSGHGNQLYWIWTGMRQRCRNPKSKQYPRWGGRGVTICPEWEDFIPFRDWAYKTGYMPGLTIERIDFNGNYCPENCTWLERKHQSRNTSVIKILPSDVPCILARRANGETHKNIALSYNVSRELIRDICNNKRKRRIIL